MVRHGYLQTHTHLQESIKHSRCYASTWIVAATSQSPQLMSPCMLHQLNYTIDCIYLPKVCTIYDCTNPLPLADTHLELYSVVKAALSHARLTQEYRANGVVSPLLALTIGGHRINCPGLLTSQSNLCKVMS